MKAPPKGLPVARIANPEVKAAPAPPPPRRPKAPEPPQRATAGRQEPPPETSGDEKDENDENGKEKGPGSEAPEVLESTQALGRPLLEQDSESSNSNEKDEKEKGNQQGLPLLAAAPGVPGPAQDSDEHSNNNEKEGNQHGLAQDSEHNKKDSKDSEDSKHGDGITDAEVLALRTSWLAQQPPELRPWLASIPVKGVWPRDRADGIPPPPRHDPPPAASPATPPPGAGRVA